jgi:phosphoserine phosphatase
MIVKTVVIDFDGTIVTRDLTDMLSGLAGKAAESQELDRMFQTGQLKGLQGLVKRINFLSGISVKEISDALEKDDFLREGARDLFDYLRACGIITIIASGSSIPLLELYQKKLGADYIVGSKPKVKDGRIVSIREEDYSGPDFKAHDTSIILESLGIPPSQAVAIGDSPADLGLFELAGASISINPRYGIDKHCDYVIHDNLALAIPIIQSLSKASTGNGRV